jgi:hypothetical protein
MEEDRGREGESERDRVRVCVRVCVWVREREDGSVGVRRNVSEESSNMTTIILTL